MVVRSDPVGVSVRVADAPKLGANLLHADLLTLGVLVHLLRLHGLYSLNFKHRFIKGRTHKGHLVRAKRRRDGDLGDRRRRGAHTGTPFARSIILTAHHFSSLTTVNGRPLKQPSFQRPICAISDEVRTRERVVSEGRCKTSSARFQAHKRELRRRTLAILKSIQDMMI